MSKRQKAFTIKTNQLSDVVYNRLEEKAQGRKLGDYIEYLVIKDLTGREMVHTEANPNTYQILEQINKQLQDLTQLATKRPLSLQKNTVENADKDKEEVQSEGQIVKLEDVTGELDDDDLEELDF